MNKKKAIRDAFRKIVLQRDGYKCRVCGSAKVELDVHHITDRNLIPNGGYVAENGITLCADSCHLRAEEFHISQGVSWYDKMHPDDLYALINSSYQIALEKSKIEW